MNQELYQGPQPRVDEDEINLLDLWAVIWRWRRFIVYFATIIVFFTVAFSLCMPNMYEAKAVITPVAGKDQGAGASMAAIMAQQFGIGQPMQSTAYEVLNLLKSNVVREKMLEKYQLLPVLFSEKWDEGEKNWKRPQWWDYLNPLRLLSYARKLVTPEDKAVRKKDPFIPDAWDGIRRLEKLITINQTTKENTITVTVEFRDPEIAARLCRHLLDTTIDHISEETKRVSLTNKKYLETQLADNADPFIKQKIYMLIAQQIEMVAMAEVKENFAFKVLDPPKAPDRKSKPKRAWMAVIAFVTSLFMGVMMAFFLEYLEKQGVRMEMKGRYPFVRMERIKGDEGCRPSSNSW